MMYSVPARRGPALGGVEVTRMFTNSLFIQYCEDVTSGMSQLLPPPLPPLPLCVLLLLLLSFLTAFCHILLLHPFSVNHM